MCAFKKNKDVANPSLYEPLCIRAYLVGKNSKQCHGNRAWLASSCCAIVPKAAAGHAPHNFGAENNKSKSPT